MAPNLRELVSMYTKDGPSYDWNPARDAAVLDKFANNGKLPVHHKFDTCEQALVILGQSVKHSAHLDIKAVNDILTLPLRAQFVKKADSKPGTTTRYMVFISVPADFVSLISLYPCKGSD